MKFHFAMTIDEVLGVALERPSVPPPPRRRSQPTAGARRPRDRAARDPSGAGWFTASPSAGRP